MLSALHSARAYVHTRKWRRAEISYSGLTVAQWWAFRGEIVWLYLLGAVFIVSPKDWFGPEWSAFDYLPHGGLGLGLACVLLGTVLAAAVYLRSIRVISVVLLLGAVTFWVSAFLIGMQALKTGTGLMETPLMMYVSVDMMIRSAIARR